MKIKVTNKIEFKEGELTFLKIPEDLRVPALFFVKEEVSSTEESGIRTFRVCVKPKILAGKKYLKSDFFNINIEVDIKTKEWINTYKPISYKWFQGDGVCDIENISYGVSLYRILVLKHHRFGNELSFYDDLDMMIEEFYLYVDCYVKYALKENIKIVDELNSYFFEIENTIYKSIIKEGLLNE